MIPLAASERQSGMVLCASRTAGGSRPPAVRAVLPYYSVLKLARFEGQNGLLGVVTPRRM